MNIKIAGFLFVLLISLSACQPATPMPAIDAIVGERFILAPEQTVTITDAGFAITLNSVVGDARCPANVECAASGPVSLSISIQKGSDTPAQFNMQTFTSDDGIASEFNFEGIQSKVEFEGYTIGIKSVLPYPQELEEKIRPGDYRVTFTVSGK